MRGGSVGRLDGKVAVITGGASGIGLETARRFVAEGARVVLGDLDPDRAAEAAGGIGDGTSIVAEAVDVREEADVALLVARAVEVFGGLHLAVNSAGLGTWSPIHQHPLEEWNHVVDVCLTGVFLSVKHEAAAMVAAGDGGVIINLASINAKVPSDGMVAYCSAKAGVEMLTRVAAMELGPHGVRVVALGPGFVDTPLTAFASLGGIRDAFVASVPMGRIGRPGDIADAALFLASDEASWISGETLYVDGAESTKGYPVIGDHLAALGDELAALADEAPEGESAG